MENEELNVVEEETIGVLDEPMVVPSSLKPIIVGVGLVGAGVGALVVTGGKKALRWGKNKFGKIVGNRKAKKQSSENKEVEVSESSEEE